MISRLFSILQEAVKGACDNYEPKGQGFESLQARHSKTLENIEFSGVFSCLHEAVVFRISCTFRAQPYFSCTKGRLFRALRGIENIRETVRRRLVRLADLVGIGVYCGRRLRMSEALAHRDDGRAAVDKD